MGDWGALRLLSLSPDEKIVVLRKIFDEFAASGSVEGLFGILTEDVVYRVTGDETLRVVRNGEVFSSDWAVVCKWRGDRVRSVLVIENLGPLSAAYA